MQEGKSPAEKSITVTFDSEEERADIFLTKKLKIPRNQIQKLIEEGLVKINGRVVTRKSERLKRGSIVEVILRPQEGFVLRRERIPLEIIWEDDEYIVINKPAGMVVHPSPHHPSGTIVNAIIENVVFDIPQRISQDSLVRGEIRPGIVHRLDKDVSGVMIIAKNVRALEKASELFRKREVKKTYIAMCFGYTEKSSWEIRKRIGRADSGKVMRIVRRGGKEAMTVVRTLCSKRDVGLSLFELYPQTGRTHQLRVHMSSEGFPIVADGMYGGGGQKLKVLMDLLGNIEVRGIFLHSLSLEIFERKFIAKLPGYFEDAIRRIFGDEVLNAIYEHTA